MLGPKQAWFLFNERDQAVETAVGLEGARRARDLLEQSLSRDGDRLTLRLEPFDVRCLILEA